MDRGMNARRHVHPLTAVGELLRERPSTLAVLDRHGVVFCAGCYFALMDPLSDVVGYHAVHDREALFDELDRAADGPGGADDRGAPGSAWGRASRVGAGGGSLGSREPSPHGSRRDALLYRAGDGQVVPFEPSPSCAFVRT